MNKKVDKKIEISTVGGITKVLYKHSFAANITNEIVISHAVLKLNLGVSATNLGLKIFEVRNEIKQIIDFVEHTDVNGNICIDITNELAINLKDQKPLTLEIVGDKNFEVDTTKCEVIILYQSIKLRKEKTLVDLSAKEAGRGTLDLSTGNLIWAKDNILYNGLNVTAKESVLSYDGESKILLPKSMSSQGWRLSAEQYLVEENNAEMFSDNETSSVFTYVDGSGNQIQFLEKYYYTNEDKEKKYVSKANVEFTTEGKFKLQDSDIIVEKEIETDSQYTLTNSIEGISKSYLYENEQEELIIAKEKQKQLGETIQELENNITSSRQQLLISALTKKMLQDQIDFQKSSIAETETSLDYEKKITEIVNNYNKKTRSFDHMNLASILLGDKNFEKTLLDQIYMSDVFNKWDDDTYETNVYDAKNNNYMLVQDVKVLIKNLITESNTMLTLGFDYTSNTSGRLYMQKKSNDDNKKIYVTELTLSSLKEEVKKVLGESCYQNNEIEEAFQDNLFVESTLTMSIKEILSINTQIKQLENSITKLKSNILECKEQKEKADMMVLQLERQVPVHYLRNNNGKILGFGKTNDNKIFRLVVMADSYENAVYLNYDNENKLVSIIDTEKQETSIEYENDLIKEIIDTKNRKTTFGYENEKLVSIKNEHGEENKYTYDEENRLINAIEKSGYGVNLEYTNGKVTKYSEISSAELINKNGIKHVAKGLLSINGVSYSVENENEIEYTDYLNTTVIDKKSKKSVTYIFDNEGKLTTVYENKLDIEGVFGNVNAISYNSIGNKKKFAIKPVQTYENLLNGEYENSEKSTVSETYLGDDIMLGEELCLTSYIVESADVNTNSIYSLPERLNSENKLTQNLDISKIKLKRNEGVTDFVLSGWASADSAWVNRRATDYCKECDDETENNELEKLIKNSADENKKGRRFELRAEIKYINNGVEKLVEQYGSFDWMQTGWQYCAIPVTLSEESEDDLVSMKVIFDYSNNTNGAKFYGMKLVEGEWHYTELEDGQTVYEESSDSEFITRHKYEDKMLKESIMIDKSGKEFTTKYEYNKQGSLIRIEDYNGLVNEKEYNNQGQEIKSYTYNKTEPTAKIFQTETLLDEKGKQTGVLNELGEESQTYNYQTGTELLTSVKDKNGNETVYGYDSQDNIVSVSTSIQGESNTNRTGYNFGLQTELEHNGVIYNFEYDGFGKVKEIKINNSSYVTMEYDETNTKEQYNNGEHYLTKTDAEGKVEEVTYGRGDENKKILQNVYDTFGRVIESKDYTNVCQSVSNPVKYSVEYDKHGRAVRKNYSLDNTNVEVQTKYNVLNKIQESTEQIGNTVRRYGYSYEVTPESRLFGIEMPNGRLERPEYDKLGRVSMVKHYTENSIPYSKNYNYMQKGDHTSEQVASEWFGINSEMLDSLKYSYDEKGNITSVKENGEIITAYLYDSLSRLIREDNKKLGKTYTFQYDVGGNIIYKKEYNYTLGTLEEKEPITTNIYKYPLSGWKDQLQNWNGKKFEYDSLGNPTKYKDLTLGWSNVRQLSNYNGVGFKYNASGLRISKTVSNVETKYILDGDKLLAQDNGNKLFFNYGVEGISGFTYEGVGEYFYKKNMQGDVLSIMDEHGTEIVKYAYDGWSNHESYILNDNKYISTKTSEILTPAGTNNKTICELNPIRYRGYYYDTETKLYYLQSRYYDPELGRFLNADSLDYLTFNSINGLNLYAYCLNNPITFADSTGNMPESIQNLFAYTERFFTGLSDFCKNIVKFPKHFSLSWKEFHKSNPGFSKGEFYRGNAAALRETNKMAKSFGKVASFIAFATLAIDIGSSWINNYNSGSASWFTDSLVDTAYIGGRFAIGVAISAAFSLIPFVGWMIGIGVAIGIDTLIVKYASEAVNAIKSWAAGVGNAINKGLSNFANGWNAFWSFNWL